MGIATMGVAIHAWKNKRGECLSLEYFLASRSRAHALDQRNSINVTRSPSPSPSLTVIIRVYISIGNVVERIESGTELRIESGTDLSRSSPRSPSSIFGDAYSCVNVIVDIVDRGTSGRRNDAEWNSHNAIWTAQNRTRVILDGVSVSGAVLIGVSIVGAIVSGVSIVDGAKSGQRRWNTV